MNGGALQLMVVLDGGPGRDALEVTDMTAEHQERLIEVFAERPTQPAGR